MSRGKTIGWSLTPKAVVDAFATRRRTAGGARLHQTVPVFTDDGRPLNRAARRHPERRGR